MSSDKCFALFVYPLNPFDTKTLKDLDAKKFLKKWGGANPRNLTRYFNRWSKKDYFSKKCLKKHEAKFRRATVTGDACSGLFLNVSLDLPCSATETVHRRLCRDFDQQVQKWHESPEDHPIPAKVGKRTYALDFVNSSKPCLMISELGVIFSKDNKCALARQCRDVSKAVKKTLDKHDDGNNILLPFDNTYVWDPLFWNSWNLPFSNSTPVGTTNSTSKNKLLQEFQRDIDSYMLGSCTNTFSRLSQTPLKDLPPYEIFQIRSKNGDIICFNIKTLHHKCKSEGRYWNPFGNSPMKSADKNRLANQFIINGLDPVMS